VSTDLVSRVRDYAEKHHLFRPGRVIVGVSGGADSLTLLHLLLTLRDPFGIDLYVATFDHGIRGEVSAEDVRYVQLTAATWGVPCIAGRVTQDRPYWSEAEARQERYQFFARVAAEIGAETVAVAHHQNDLVETVLMHLIRGTGLAGLRGIMPDAPLPYAHHAPIPRLVRPLLDISRHEINMYVRDHGLEPREDATNADTTLLRNHLRHEILPRLGEINPQIWEAIARMADSLREDYATLQTTLPKTQPQGAIVAFPRSAFLALPISQQRLLIRSMAQQVCPDVELSFAATDAALAHIRNGLGKVNLGYKLWLQIGEKLTIWYEVDFPLYYPALPPSAVYDLPAPGHYALGRADWTLAIEIASVGLAADPNDPLTLLLNLPPNAAISLRTWQAGDRFEYDGVHVQKLSDTFINMGVPQPWRGCVPLLCINGMIAAFVAPTLHTGRLALRINPRFQPNPETPIWRFNFSRGVSTRVS
jgi:tRNA(Ile)-lysidine synthase